MTGFGRASLLCVLAVTMAACQRMSQVEYRKIDTWLLCDDCLSGERDAVKALGQKAVYTLDRALVGPSPARLANKEAQFRQMFHDLQTPAFTDTGYIARQRANYVARYQKRAALSLGDIGGRRALDALKRAQQSAAEREYRADVVNVIDEVLALGRDDRFRGTVSADSARFGDTLRVRRDSGLSWNGTEAVLLRGSRLPDSLVIGRWASNSLAFVAAAPIGHYALEVTGLGPDEVSQVAPLRIVPPAFQPTAAPSTVTTFPQVRFLMLPSAKRDTTVSFRVQPAQPASVTVHVVASGLNNLRLEWRDCANQIFPPVTQLRGTVVDNTNEPVANATVQVVGTNVSAVTAANGQFALPASPDPTTDLRVSRIRFQSRVFRVDARSDSVRLGLVDSGVTAATAISRQSTSKYVGLCGLVHVSLSASGGTQLLRLTFESP